MRSLKSTFIILTGCFGFFVKEINGEKTWLSHLIQFPPAKTLEVVHFYSIPEDSGAEIRLKGPVSIDTKAENEEGYSVSIVSHEELDKLSKNIELSFCDGKKLTIPNSYSFVMSKENINKGFSDQLYRPNSGFWYVVLANCGEEVHENIKFKSGEIVLSMRNGYLPGEDAPKLSFYLSLFLIYGLIFGVWILICGSRSAYLLKIHHYITVACLVGALEAVCWYASLYHWNFIGHRWWSMISLASLGTVTKQGVCYGLLLLACLGLGITKPRLENKQMVHSFLLVFSFIISDGLRQMALVIQDRVHGIESNIKIFLLVAPGSLFVSALYTWIWSALTDTINELKEKKQTVKLELYNQLRNSIGICCVLVCFGVIYETFIVRRTDLSVNWSTRWIFTDAMSHIVFLMLLIRLMCLWLPTERSLQLAYSDQIVYEMESQKEGCTLGGNDNINGGIEMVANNDSSSLPKDFQSVDVELGEEEQEDEDDFSFNKSMQEAKKGTGKPVLE